MKVLVGATEDRIPWLDESSAFDVQVDVIEGVASCESGAAVFEKGETDEVIS